MNDNMKPTPRKPSPMELLMAQNVIDGLPKFPDGLKQALWVAYCIRDAVEEERERCAAIADSHGVDPTADEEDPSDCAEFGAEIAERIRSQK